MKLSHCADLVQTQDKDRFLASLFIPAPARESLMTLYALNIELEHVGHAVSEEMIGHIRYAWWQEAIDALYEGKPARNHPVLQALALLTGFLPREELNRLIEAYREHFPNAPDVDGLLDSLSASLLQAQSVDTRGWQKANRVIATHRARYGRGMNGWLSLKLLAAGLA